MEEIQELVALDVETTGLNPAEDRIIEIALIRIKEGNIAENFVTLLNPERSIPPEVSYIHGITDDDIRESPFFRDIATKVIDIINERTILVHNAAFDIPFVKKELNLCGIELSDIKIIDTLAIAREHFFFRKNSLSVIAAHYGIDISGVHRAEADAKITYNVYRKLLEDLRGKK